ncbi:MAG: ankyrin repeat domain-containing protein [Balneolaceae bacterium]
MKTISLIFLSAFLFIAPARAIDADIKYNSTTVIADNLFEAIQNIDIVSLNILLADGADVDTMNHNGETPLMAASKIGNMRMLNILLMHNPDVNKRNNNGQTALMIASENGQLFVAERLLQKGADASLKNNKGETAKDLALKNGHKSLLDLFEGKEIQFFSR